MMCRTYCMHSVCSYYAFWTVCKQERTSVKPLCQLSAGGSGEQHEDLDFFIPPPWAIAHHLIKIWAEQPSAWFSAKL